MKFINQFVFLLFSFTYIQLPLLAQYENIKIGDGGDGIEFYDPCEPSICVNPTNTKNIIAGAILSRVYYSMDGGYTWEVQKLKSTHGVFGDPALIADMEGNIYYLHLSDPDQRGWSSEKLLDRIVCQRSEDGGKTWNNGGYMGLDHPKDQDKQWAVANPENGNLYATWTQFDLYDSRNPEDSTHILFSISKDGGETWSDAIRINQIGGDCIDSDNTVEGAVPSVGVNGEIFVAWQVNEKMYFDKSLDEGKTWLAKDKLIATQPGGWDFKVGGIGRTNGFAVTGVDLSESSPYKGRLYVNWSDQRNGKNDTDIWIISSDDAGETWTEPKRVNDDPAGKQQFFNWMAVDPVTGYIYIVFYDRRNHHDNTTDVYLAYSKDGGETFINEKISEKPFLANNAPFFGDYNNISAYDGVVRPIWTREDNRRLSVWTAIIDMN